MIVKDKYAKLIDEHKWWFPLWNSLVNAVISSMGKISIENKEGCISADLHVHSIYSGCSISKPEDIIKKAVSIGLSCIGIMDHNTVDGALDIIETAEILKQKGEISDSFIVIPGCEISNSEVHIGALFLDKKIPRDLNINETLLAIKEAGGISIAVHPFHRTGVGEDFHKYNFDAVETRCGSIFSEELVKLHQNIENDSILKHIAKLGTSDGHYINAIGLCSTYIEIDNISSESIKNAILNGKTIPVSSELYHKICKMIGNIMDWHDRNRRNKHS
ncbi:MAG: PHP domain-containing protein [Armatimonadota bacterium]